jgi:hypothetical protein
LVCWYLATYSFIQTSLVIMLVIKSKQMLLVQISLF